MEPTKELDYTLLSGNLPKNWEKPPTPDEILDAYEAGKTEQARVNLRVLNENLESACSSAEQLYRELVQIIGLECLGLHMRIVGLSRFQALFLVDLKGFISDKRNLAYASATSASKATVSSTFHIEFSFMPVSDHVNLEAIYSDGYFLTYIPNGKKTGPRKTQPKSL